MTITTPIKQPNSSTEHWQRLLSPQRLGAKHPPSSNPANRSQFHKDYDRLVFSHSFRQLNQKTQVHPLSNQMGIHTRLTHSLEVSCIGRSLGTMAAEKLHDTLSGGLPVGIGAADVGVIIQAACIAHDIGNPPFGHAGEYAIRDWFMRPAQQQRLGQLSINQRLDILAYEGNSQGFRVLTRNEHHPDKGGMRLTCATLGAFMKYPWLASHANPSAVEVLTGDAHTDPPLLTAQTALRKFGCFDSEAAQLEELAHVLALPRSSTHEGFARHPLAYLLEAADDICYALIDLEDGINLNMLSYPEVAEILYTLIGDVPETIALPHYASVRQHLAGLRARAMMRLVNTVTDAFADNAKALLAGELEGSLFTHCAPDIQAGIYHAKKLAQDKIFNHPSKVRMELMANQCLHRLLDALMPLAWQSPSEHAPFEQQRLQMLLQPHLAEHRRSLTDDTYTNILTILDFITGMNDHEAYRLAQELQGHWNTMV